MVTCSLIRIESHRPFITMILLLYGFCRGKVHVVVLNSFCTLSDTTPTTWRHTIPDIHHPLCKKEKIFRMFFLHCFFTHLNLWALVLFSQLSTLSNHWVSLSTFKFDYVFSTGPVMSVVISYLSLPEQRPGALRRVAAENVDFADFGTIHKNMLLLKVTNPGARWLKRWMSAGLNPMPSTGQKHSKGGSSDETPRLLPGGVCLLFAWSKEESVNLEINAYPLCPV